MDSSEFVEAAMRTARRLGLRAESATVLSSTNRMAIRIRPCDVLVRVAPSALRPTAEYEIQMATALADADCLIAPLEPRVEPVVHDVDGLVLTLWAYCQPVPPETLDPDEYSHALARMHAGMRRIDPPAQHFTDRVAEATRSVADPDRTPDLTDSDRSLLASTLEETLRSIRHRAAPEQLLHGEPHPGNVLRTESGLLLIDLETICRGPIEFDLAHTPRAVAEHYPDLDRDLLRDCRTLMLAMVTTWRWQRGDAYPNGQVHRVAGVAAIRAARERADQRDVGGADPTAGRMRP